MSNSYKSKPKHYGTLAIACKLSFNKLALLYSPYVEQRHGTELVCHRMYIELCLHTCLYNNIHHVREMEGIKRI